MIRRIAPRPPHLCAALLALLTAGTLLAPQVHGQDHLLTEIRAVQSRALYMDGFVLKHDQEVRVDAYCPVARYGELGAAWILDARSREVVWEMAPGDEAHSRRGARESAETLHLPAGAYEVYFASFPLTDHAGWHRREWADRHAWDRVTLNNLGDFIGALIDDIFDGGGRSRDSWFGWDDAYSDGSERFGVSVTGTGDGYAEHDRARLASAFFADAFVSLTNLDDDRYVHQGFSLAQPMDVEVYAVGELYDNNAFDYGWIVDVDTHAPVWRMDWHGSRHAGGVSKNRVANEILHLPAGRYAAFFVTDDSHSPERWNAAPPYDPFVWGLTLLPADPAMRRHVSLFDYEQLRREGVLVDLTRMRDGERKQARFTLDRAADVQVSALGEGNDGEMYDYGWIVDDRTGRVVWEMKYRTTGHAGGAAKNRLANTVVRLDAGTYTVFFETDGSHSFGDWNAAPPADPAGWGITIRTAAR